MLEMVHFMLCTLTQPCLTLCDPMDYMPGSSVLGFFRQESWSGLPSPSPEDLPDPGIEPESPGSPALQTDSLPLSHQGTFLHNKENRRSELSHQVSAPEGALWAPAVEAPGASLDLLMDQPSFPACELPLSYQVLFWPKVLGIGFLQPMDVD